MEYRYSKGKKGDLIDVTILSEKNRHDFGPYYCLGCEAEIIPILGKKKAHHFRHKVETSSCAHETYLHHAAKMSVAEGFRRAKSEAQIYSLRIEHPYNCPISKVVNGLKCRISQEQDLTDWYQDADVEVGINGFVADVLLTSPIRPPLLIEIKVTHSCETKKISSGLRIIEIEVRNEGDIVSLRAGIDATSPNVHIHGLNPKPLVGACHGDCVEEARTFILFKNGKTWMGMKTFTDIQRQSRQKNVERIEIIEGDWEESDLTIFDIDPHVQRACFDLNKRVRSCLLCRHHAFSTGRTGGQLPIWCFEHRVDVGHNKAAECSSFQGLSKKDLDRKRQKLGEKTAQIKNKWIIDTILPILRN